MSEPSTRGQSTPPRDGDSKDSLHDQDHPHPRKRQRVRLSCLECRRRKLSCDRELPCSRCLQSGTPEKCDYETRPGLSLTKPAISPNVLGSLDGRLSLPSITGDSLLFPRKDALREHERIRKLEVEVAQLKTLLLASKQVSQASLDGGSTVVEHSPATQDVDDAEARVDVRAEVEAPLPSFLQSQAEGTGDKDELRFHRRKEFKTRYFGPHSAYQAFAELAGLTGFMNETSEEWLRPLRKLQDRKNRHKDKQDREKKFFSPDPELEALLPSKEETDAYVSVYLDQFEQVHRIIHIPSFRHEYAKFWDPNETRYAAFTVLVLAILSITSCVREHPGVAKFDKLVSNAHSNAVKWIAACDAWQEHQSQKHRRLIHFQISCLLYLSKRINAVKKKRFWKNACALTEDAICVGLHREPTPKISAFNREMRRRIWATIQSFDLQACFDHGLPSLLPSLPSDVLPPRNIDDEEFNEDSEELPDSKPTTEYTYSSYQHISRQSLPLRLELCRVLTGRREDLDYDQVIEYTSRITHEIDGLPSWDANEAKVSETEGKTPLLAFSLLHIQLRSYIVPLHQPYLRLRKTNPKYQYSEMIYYSSVRDMILLNDALMKQGIRTLNFLREDSLTLAINLASVTMLQPRGSTNMIMISSQDTLRLIEKCLLMREDRILRCGNSEPWGYSVLCAARELLAVHLGEKTAETAKAAAAERFVNLHLKLIAGQDPPAPTQQSELLSRANHPPPSQSMPMSSLNPLAAVSATAAGLSVQPPMSSDMSRARSKSVTPFPASQGSVTLSAAAQVEVPGTPWWIPNPSDPSAVTPMLPINPDLSFEVFGMDLNSLWGGDIGEWDGEPVF